MTYAQTKSLAHFKFWSGAKDHNFTYAELNYLEPILEDLFEEIPSETQINDLFWFEEELLCELLGIEFDEYEER